MTIRSGASMRDSHGRLFELQQGREFAGIGRAVLISGFTRDDDPMLGQKQRQRNQEMRQELANEAASVNVEFCPVLSASEGATRPQRIRLQCSHACGFRPIADH